MSTQTKHPWRATLRTVFSVVIAAAAAMPLIVQAITGDDADLAAGGFAVALTVSAAVTRLMAVPVINDVLALVGLGAEPRVRDEPEH